jgi:allophanate hydrolase
VREADDLRAEARSLERSGNRRGSLYGIPFGVKDNIDVAGIPTTAACPEFAYMPGASSPVVDRLRAAGALFVGKTNLDQFATGLVGVRSPYGIPPNPFDARFVSGGSSSGSAAAVARGHVPFALATDTAGSGRVPAGFNNLVGLKPSRGLLSTRGMVPACRSLDCVSIMALTCPDARDIAAIACGFDGEDPFSRRAAEGFRWSSPPPAAGFRVGAPRREDLAFGDDEGRHRFDRACAQVVEMGGVVEPVDMAPFFEAGSLLYDGPWIAERLASLEEFVRTHPGALLPVLASILARGESPRATDAFRGYHRLRRLKRSVEALWGRLSALIVPAAPAIPRIDEVEADPIQANVRLGRYTNFVNLLDLAAVAVPAGFRRDGLPLGVTFLGPWGRDATLIALASAFHERTGGTLGATGAPLSLAADAAREPPAGFMAMAVVGAHLTGQPLNHQLTERGGVFLRSVRTAPRYRLYALPETTPPKPGLLRVRDEAGARIELEIWALPAETIGSFLAGIASPLSLGTIELEDGARIHGFLCEGSAVEGARDISSFGGWRGYLCRPESLP